MNLTHRNVFLLGAMMLFAACSSDSCSCSGFESREFPADKYTQTIPTSGEARLTQSGIKFLEDNLPEIAMGLLPDGLNFCIPRSEGDQDICYRGEVCDDGSQGCQMALTLDDAQLTPQPPDTIAVTLTVGDLDERLSVGFNFFGQQDCYIDLHAPGNAGQPGTITVTVPVQFSVDANSPLKELQVRPGKIDADLSNLDYSSSGTWACGGANLGFVKDYLKGEMLDRLEPMILEMLDQQLCRACDAGTCPSGASCNAETDLCEYPSGQCVPRPFGAEGRVLFGDLLSSYTEEREAAVDLIVRAADHAEVDTGLTIGLRSGYHPDLLRRCVPADPTVRNYDAPPISAQVASDTKPGSNEPFHFGVGYHKKAMEHLLWSMWGSGATCLNVGSDDVGLLSTSTLGLLLPSIRKLAYGEASAAYVKIVPQQAPTVQLGANTVTPSGSSYTIDEGLITLDWKDLDVHIYGYVQDRFTRLFTLRLDLLLPMAIVPNGQGEIVPVLGDVEEAIQNERIVSNELLEEDPEKILDLLPTLLGYALPSIASTLSEPIAIPEFFGFRIVIEEGDITSVDNNTSVALFANLEFVGPMPYTASLDTAIVHEPTVDYGRRLPSGIVRPVIELDVLSLETGLPIDGTTGETEYSYRVDGGLWSLYHRSSTLRIDDPMLVIPGVHTVEVRARRVGEIISTDPTPARIDVVVDYEQPTLAIERRGAELSFEASDLVDDVAELKFRYRIVTGDPATSRPWSAWSHTRTLDLDALELPERFRIVVEARDRAGNVASDTQTVTRRQTLGPATVPPTRTAEPSSVGCSTGATGAPGGALLLFVLALFAMRLRRREMRLGHGLKLVLLSGVLSVGACQCGDEPGETSVTCEPACAEGQTCVDGACMGECTGNGDCADGEICVSGACQLPACPDDCPSCPDGQFTSCEDDGQCACVSYCEGGCGEDEYCCYESNSCEPLPDPCADTMCDPGYEPKPGGEATVDSAACSVGGLTCECEPLPPLPIGWHGHYAAIAQGGGIIALATYNSTYGDLMVATLDTNFEPTWYWVDGVPADGDVEGDPEGPRGGIKDKGDDVGTYTAIAVDDEGALHVLYRDEERGVLKYARGTLSGAEYTFELADFDIEGDTGYWPALTIVDTDVHAVWTARSVETDTGFETQLRHTRFSTSAALDALASTVQIVDAKPAANPCGFACEERNAECVASAGVCATETNDCADACAEGSICYMGTCELVYTEPLRNYLPAVASNTELRPSPDGLLVVYYDALEENAHFASFADGAWGLPVPFEVGTAGPYATAVATADGLHRAYMNHADRTLVYENDTMREVVMDGTRDTPDGWIVNDIGEDITMHVAEDGAVTLVFQDATRHILYTARRDGAGRWTVDELATPGDPYTGAHGFYATLLQLADVQLIVELVINNQTDPASALPVFHR